MRAAITNARRDDDPYVDHQNSADSADSVPDTPKAEQ
jgi:hypothetical protein